MGTTAHISSVRALQELIQVLETRWLPETEEIEGSYAWESLPMQEFIPGLEESLVVPPGKFLDVGCGIGSKLLVAQSYGFQVSGLEVRPEYVSVARIICPNADVILGDAMEFTRYGEYDFIYCYRPFKEDSKEDQLEDRIIAQMKSGAWVFLPHRNWLPQTERGNMHWMGTPIWRKAW